MAEPFDLIVIGGGILGAGIARDAAQRGLSVVLVEQGDFGGGTTAATSKLIHGGLRYLQSFDLSLVRTSLQERRILLSQMPHLVKPIPILLPSYPGRTVPSWPLRMGLTFYDSLHHTARLPRHVSLSKSSCLQRLPSLNPEGLSGGFLYHDAQVVFPERLCLANALTAERLGAEIRNHQKVEDWLMAGDRVEGVVVTHRLTGEREELRSRFVVNVTGPWHNELVARLPSSAPRVEHVKGSHIIVQGETPLPLAAYSPAKSDGRPVFFTPWRDVLLVGTTEAPFHGSLDHVAPSAEEMDYLTTELRTLFPQWPFRLLYGFSGVRALPTGDGNVHRRSRGHRLLRHDRMGGPRNLLSVIGGKMTTYRATAQEAVNVVGQFLNCTTASRTAATRLDGAVRVDVADYIEHLRRTHGVTGLDLHQIEYLVTVYGTRAEKILDLALAEPALRRRLCPHQPDIAAQIRLSREEHVVTLQDFLWRRTGIGGRGCLGKDCAKSIAHLLGKELGWSAEMQANQAETYLAAMATERSAGGLATDRKEFPAPPPPSPLS